MNLSEMKPTKLLYLLGIPILAGICTNHLVYGYLAFPFDLIWMETVALWFFVILVPIELDAEKVQEKLQVPL